MDTRIRALEGQLGRKTLETEIPKVALEKSRSKTDLACAAVETGRFPMTAVTTALGVSRSNLYKRANGSAKPRRGYHKAQDAVVLPRIQTLVAKRPTYGCRRITALLNRELANAGISGSDVRDILLGAVRDGSAPRA